jgi:hypothetical protein
MAAKSQCAALLVRGRFSRLDCHWLSDTKPRLWSSIASGEVRYRSRRGRRRYTLHSHPAPVFVCSYVGFWSVHRDTRNVLPYCWQWPRGRVPATCWHPVRSTTNPVGRNALLGNLRCHPHGARRALIP